MNGTRSANSEVSGFDGAAGAAKRLFTQSPVPLSFDFSEEKDDTVK